ncbi:methyltransferase family protein [Merismopedia glauca]|uniref:Steroid 5-alpha reductase n=1 Tax=Merismopedia glauca CCAP 1448/3 TaxID=1296344 RepID=A0A2T1BZK2_9CYAN|nr:DUF1295 domain-containing protein [Merismopedia glauca]PSB01431.1 steroid 5-alpha reductase [Merismopedia glauca CCAP 1448/3]
MKTKHFVNLHKGTTFFFVLALMFGYNNFSLAPWIYLSLHGTYGFLWLLKDRIYPDKQWEQEVSIPLGVTGFLILCLYWVAPFILISSGSTPPLYLVWLAVSLNIIGVFLHFASDSQKYYTLKYRSGLIDEGFFARCRNTNYLGEFLIYLSFAILTQHWLPLLILAGFLLGIFVPNMLKKDNSLAKYPGFVDYQANSGLFFPKLFGVSTRESSPEDRVTINS